MPWSLAAASKDAPGEGKKDYSSPKAQSEVSTCELQIQLKRRVFSHREGVLGGVHPPQSQRRVLPSASRRESIIGSVDTSILIGSSKLALGIAAASGISHLCLGNQSLLPSKFKGAKGQIFLLLVLFFIFLFGKASEKFLKGLSQQLPSCFITLSTATSSN